MAHPGETVRLLCAAYSRVIWYKKQEGIEEVRDHYKQTSSHSSHHYLTLYSVSRKDAVPYYCIGQDKNRNFFRKHFELLVGSKLYDQLKGNSSTFAVEQFVDKYHRAVLYTPHYVSGS